MKRFSIIVLIFICVVSIGISNALAEPILYDWAFNINDDFYFAPDFYTGPDPGQLPSYLDDSGFDWDTGLGTIKISYSPGIAGSYHILSFFDHEIDEGLNIYFNETGASHGSLASGQSWEIDEPGWGRKIRQCHGPDAGNHDG